MLISLKNLALNNMCTESPKIYNYNDQQLNRHDVRSQVQS